MKDESDIYSLKFSNLSKISDTVSKAEEDFENFPHFTGL